MPTTIGGLAIFVVFLTPGFLNYLQRKWRVPQRKLSPLVEIATLLSVSVFTNLVAIGLFAAVRTVLPKHTPNVQRVLIQGSTYIFPRIGYIAAWSLGILVVSCIIAVLIGSGVLPFDRIITPVMIDSSAWYQVFDSAPDNAKIYVGCDLSDGSYVSGYLDYYNTDVDEVADRDLVIAAPIEIKMDEKTESSRLSTDDPFCSEYHQAKCVLRRQGCGKRRRQYSPRRIRWRRTPGRNTGKAKSRIAAKFSTHRPSSG